MALKYPLPLSGSDVQRWLLPNTAVHTTHCHHPITNVSADQSSIRESQQIRPPALPPTPCPHPVTHADGDHVPHSSTTTTTTTTTVICDFDTALLRSPSTFPYFMLVAMEAGGLLRALFLLLLYPIICFLPHTMSLKVMAFVSFCGLRTDAFRAGTAVLPKHLLDAVGKEGVTALVTSAKGSSKRVCLTSMPRVMVEGFLRGYLGVDMVVGSELVTLAGYYTGMLRNSRRKVLQQRQSDGGRRTAVVGIVGEQSSRSNHDGYARQLLSLCEDVHVISNEEKRHWNSMSKEDQKELLMKPLVFHDGRLAFRPTPAAVLGAFLWLPLGFLLAIIRATVFLTLPYHLSQPIIAFTGIYVRVIDRSCNTSKNVDSRPPPPRLYVCNHRTLLDPLYIAVGLQRSVTAVTYSLSAVSEILSPIRTVRLTRNREEDRRKMIASLRGPVPLVVCPEGTTCREPYLLRFSPLFAELGEEVAPVAMESQVGTFHGTTAAGQKCLDPLFFLMNPIPSYTIRFLERVSLAVAGEERYCEIANLIQSRVAEALGYDRTPLTRRDKYLLLAGNEGFSKHG